MAAPSPYLSPVVNCPARPGNSRRLCATLGNAGRAPGRNC